MRDGFSCDVATCTRPIFNEELLAHPLRKRITNQPCCRVREATGQKARDDAYRPRRIGLGSAKCDATGSAVAPAVRCKIFRRASFMVMLHELENPSLAMKNIQKRCQCLLFGTKRTSQRTKLMSAFDPKRRWCVSISERSAA